MDRKTTPDTGARNESPMASILAPSCHVPFVWEAPAFFVLHRACIRCFDSFRFCTKKKKRARELQHLQHPILVPGNGTLPAVVAASGGGIAAAVFAVRRGTVVGGRGGSSVVRVRTRGMEAPDAPRRVVVVVARGHVANVEIVARMVVPEIDRAGVCQRWLGARLVEGPPVLLMDVVEDHAETRHQRIPFQLAVGLQVEAPVLRQQRKAHRVRNPLGQLEGVRFFAHVDVKYVLESDRVEATPHQHDRYVPVLVGHPPGEFRLPGDARFGRRSCFAVAVVFLEADPHAFRVAVDPVCHEADAPSLQAGHRFGNDLVGGDLFQCGVFRRRRVLHRCCEIVVVAASFPGGRPIDVVVASRIVLRLLLRHRRCRCRWCRRVIDSDRRIAPVVVLSGSRRRQIRIGPFGGCCCCCCSLLLSFHRLRFHRLDRHPITGRRHVVVEASRVSFPIGAAVLFPEAPWQKEIQYPYQQRRDQEYRVGKNRFRKGVQFLQGELFRWEILFL